MISVKQYDALLLYARKITFRTNIDPYDVVHNAIVSNPNCGAKDVKSAYWHIWNAQSLVVEYTEDFREPRHKTKTKICKRCHEELSLGAFTYLSRGSIQNICDRCVCAHNNNHRAKNLEAARKRERDYSRRNKAKKNIVAKKHYQDNKDSKKKYVKQWRANNPEKVKEVKRKSDKKNRKKRNEAQQRRRRQQKENSNIQQF